MSHEEDIQKLSQSIASVTHPFSDLVASHLKAGFLTREPVKLDSRDVVLQGLVEKQFEAQETMRGMGLG